MSLRALAAIAIVSLVPTTARAGAAHDAQICYEAVQSSRYDAAIAFCDAALQDAAALAQRDRAITLNNRGRARLHLGELERAREDFALAADAAPDYAQPRNNLGVAEAKLDRHEAALTHYDAAIAQDDGYAHAYFNRGLSHKALGQADAAKADFTLALRHAPELSEARREHDLILAAEAEAAARRAEDATRLRKQQAQREQEAREARDRSASADASAPGIPATFPRIAMTPLEQASPVSIAARLSDAAMRHLETGENRAPAADMKPTLPATAGDAALALDDHERALRSDPSLIRGYQQALAAAGFDPGPVDGAYGPKTRTALKACLDTRRDCAPR